MTDIKTYNLIIIGAGPAGLTASIYASRYKLSNIVLGKEFGGQMAMAHLVNNYPGIEEISGADLTQKFVEHVKSLGGQVLAENVVKIEKATNGTDGVFKVTTESGKVFKAKTLILALGLSARHLNVPGEDKFLGKGVSYCATCDAPLFKDKTVAVIGGANAAATSALALSQHAVKVYIIYRREALRADTIWVEKVVADPKIEIIYKTNITKILGEQVVTGVELDNPYQGKTTLKLEGVFIEAGSIPTTSLLAPLGVVMDEVGYIQIDGRCATNVPGVFAAGDVASGSAKLRQIVTAAAEGAIAANSVFEYLKGKVAPVQWG